MTIVEFLGIQQLELTKVIINKNYESLIFPIPSVVVKAVIEPIVQLVGNLLTGPAFLVVLDTKVEAEVV